MDLLFGSDHTGVLQFEEMATGSHENKRMGSALSVSGNRERC